MDEPLQTIEHLLPLSVKVERWTNQYVAYVADIPELRGYGKTSKKARVALSELILFHLEVRVTS